MASSRELVINYLNQQAHTSWNDEDLDTARGWVRFAEVVESMDDRDYEGIYEDSTVGAGR